METACKWQDRLCGVPIKLFSLSAEGKAIVEAIEHGQLLPDGHEPLTSRLLDAGAIHPLVMPGDECTFNALDVTVVIPALVRNENDSRLLQRLVESCSFVAAVIVVDDCSPVLLPHLPSAQVVRADLAGGPGAARNIGLHLVATPLVAFIDVDVSITPETINEMLAYFNVQRWPSCASRVFQARCGHHLAVRNLTFSARLRRSRGTCSFGHSCELCSKRNVALPNICTS